MRHALLALFLVAASVLGGACAADRYATDEDRALIRQHDDKVSAAQAAVKTALEAVKQAKDDVEHAARIGDQVAFDAAAERAVAALDVLQDAERALLEAIRQAEGVTKEIRDSTIETFWSFFAPFVPPPYQAPVSMLVLGIGGQLLFKRSRQHLFTAAASTLRLQVADAIKALAKSLGWLHSEGPTVVTIEPQPPPSGGEATITVETANDSMTVRTPTPSTPTLTTPYDSLPDPRA